MGLFSTLSSLLDENSDGSLENRLGKFADGVESTLNKTLDKAESGIKKVDDAATRTVTSIQKVHTVTDKAADMAAGKSSSEDQATNRTAD